MGSIGQDTEAQLEMLIESYIKLSTKHPDHELLRLVTLHPDKRGADFSKDYQDRYVREDDRYKVHGYMRYTSALENALIFNEVEPGC
jgi:hypothetical protein